MRKKGGRVKTGRDRDDSARSKEHLEPPEAGREKGVSPWSLQGNTFISGEACLFQTFGL